MIAEMINDMREAREYFHGLTPAELERLALLGEELSEAGQAIGKILRHGYESTNPTKTNSPTNRKHLEKELGDIRHAINRMLNAGDIAEKNIADAELRKARKIEKYLHHQGGAR